MTQWIGLAALLALALAVAWWAASAYNGLVQARNGVDKAFANIDVLLVQRHDELMQLVEVVRGFMRHERDVLEKLAQLRAGYDAAAAVDEKVRLENAVNAQAARLRATCEAYPELASSASVLQLQQRISAIESSIADRREFFNDSVAIYNVKVGSAPAVGIARLTGHAPRAFLDVPADARDGIAVRIA